MTTETEWEKRKDSDVCLCVCVMRMYAYVCVLVSIHKPCGDQPSISVGLRLGFLVCEACYAENRKIPGKLAQAGFPNHPTAISLPNMQPDLPSRAWLLTWTSLGEVPEAPSTFSIRKLNAHSHNRKEKQGLLVPGVPFFSLLDL